MAYEDYYDPTEWRIKDGVTEVVAAWWGLALDEWKPTLHVAECGVLSREYPGLMSDVVNTPVKIEHALIRQLPLSVTVAEKDMARPPGEQRHHFCKRCLIERVGA